MNDFRSDDRYRRIVENIDRLPSMPAVATKLIQVVNSPESSADDAAGLIEKDPALTTKMLRLANSAFYGMPRSISSVSSAVVILGFNTIRSVALSATIMKMFTEQSDGALFDRRRFWQHSIVCALVAKSIARRGFNTLMIDPESTFCAAIMHDIGKLIFEQFVAEEFAKACVMSQEQEIPLLEAEAKVMGITHADIGTILADKWALPIELENAIVFHHRPDENDRGKELVAVVHLADILTHAVGIHIWDDEKAPLERDGTAELLSISDEDRQFFMDESKLSLEKSDEFFSIMND